MQEDINACLGSRIVIVGNLLVFHPSAPITSAHSRLPPLVVVLALEIILTGQLGKEVALFLLLLLDNRQIFDSSTFSPTNIQTAQ